MNRFSRKHSILSLVLLIALIAAMALSFVSCDKNQSSAGDQTDSQAVSAADSAGASDESNVVGEGNTSFTFTVVFADKTSKTYTVKTDKTTVGAALIDVGLISGEDSQYGLMVETVDGVKLEYNTDKMYWAFYVNDGYANSGVDSTEIRPNETYSFKATAA